MGQSMRHRGTGQGGTRQGGARDRGTVRPLPVGRLAAAAFAAGGLATSAFAVGGAGAVTGAAKSVTVSIAKNSKLGKFLVSGKTLYTLNKGNGACDSACVAIWPELVLPKGVTKATAGPGVTASKLGTVARSGGVRQVTYGGKALYYFVGDSGPGQVKGNDLKDTWGTWFAVVTAKAAGSSSTASSGSGGAGF